MRFQCPLSGRYEKINMAFMRERSKRKDDPRHTFYEAILSCETFGDYYRVAGDEYVQPITTNFPVHADMEIKYALKMGWIARS